MKFSSSFALACALLLWGCGGIEHQQQLVETDSKPHVATVGSPIATVNKQKSLPNVFGKADIYGRKVDTGFTKFVYKGPAPDGGVQVELVDVDVQSNANVFTRMPGIYTAGSSASAYGNAYAANGMATGTITASGQSSASAITPHAETNIVLPPKVTTFSIPKGQVLTLPTGQTVEFLDVQPHQVTYRVVGQPNDRS